MPILVEFEKASARFVQEPEAFIRLALAKYQESSEPSRKTLLLVFGVVVRNALLVYEDWKSLVRALLALSTESSSASSLAALVLTRHLMLALFEVEPRAWLHVQGQVGAVALRKQQAKEFEKQLARWVRQSLRNKPELKTQFARLLQLREQSQTVCADQLMVLNIVWMATLMADHMVWLGGYVTRAEEAAKLGKFHEFQEALCQWHEYGVGDVLNGHWQRVAAIVQRLDASFERGEYFFD